MPTATTGEATLHYETTGSGETVAFVGSAGYGAWQWGWQHGRVAGPYEALVYDHRGTGRSGPDAAPDSLGVSRLVTDLEAVLAAAGADRVHLVGLGLGGAVALAYAHAHGRARSLVLFGTGPDGSVVDGDALSGLFAPPGDRSACVSSLSGALSPAYRKRADIDRICAWRARDDADRAWFDAQAAAWREFAGVALYEVTVPALVVHGEADPVVPPAAGRELASGLPRGEFVAATGRHLAVVESARAVGDRLLSFLADHADGDRSPAG